MDGRKKRNRVPEDIIKSDILLTPANLDGGGGFYSPPLTVCICVGEHSVKLLARTKKGTHSFQIKFVSLKFVILKSRSPLKL